MRKAVNTQRSLPKRPRHTLCLTLPATDTPKLLKITFHRPEGSMSLHRESLLKCAFCLIAVLPLAMLATVPASAQTSTPAVISSRGYLNGTPLTTHTSAAFNSTGAFTLVAFVSSHPSWNSLPVSIIGLSDNVGNTWNVMTGPTQWVGSNYTLLS